MAEKKVSGKLKKSITENSDIKSSRNAEYDAFLAQFSQSLRKRNTKTVPEPKKHQLRAQELNRARCSEIDPHTTVNPAAEHQILTKRTGRILSDDTGFKAMDYNQRFELKAEMPELNDDDGISAQGGFEDTSVPGQQTMADLVAASSSGDEVAVPIEAKITEDENPFSIAYKALREDVGMTFGKSEKLRAIARTAADDAGMEPDSQLAFPAFSPLFKFDEEEAGKKKSRIKKKDKKNKKEEKDSKPFDIEESDIVTSHNEDSIIDGQTESPVPETLGKQHRAKRIFETINNSELQEIEPVFEMTSKSDVRTTSQKLSKSGRTELIKTGGLLLLGIVLSILSVVFSKMPDTLFPVISIIFLILSGAICIKEIADGIKDILKLKFSSDFAGVLIFSSSLLQAVTASLSSAADSVYVLAPSAIFLLTSLTLPKILLSENARTAVNMFSGSSAVSVFKTLSEGGIEGSVQMQYAADGKAIRYSSKADFVTGLMKKLTNAVPKPFAGNAMSVFAVIFALIAGIASGVINGSFLGAATAFCAMVLCCLPISYTLCAAVILFSENKKLAKNRASIISYKSAAGLVDTSAVIFDDNDIIEGSSCSIHGTKSFGKTDPKTAALCCAAAMNSAKMPIFEIMKKVIEQGNEDIPEADDYIINSRGVAAIYDHRKILLGTKDFLRENHIYIPDEDFEEKYVTGDRRLLYLSVNGEFCMLLIVSYHIKRSIANFFKYLASKGINIIIHSCDPNITGEFIAKKCRIDKSCVFRPEETETAYFKDKASKTESALPADVFTNGKISSVFALFKAAALLSKSVNALPVIIFAFSVISALAIAVPVLLGSIITVNNLYIIILKLICLAAGTGVPMLLFKEK